MSVRRILQSRRARFSALILALVAAGVPLAYHTREAIERAADGQRLTPLELALEPGTVLRYRVAWSGEQRGRLFSANAGVTETHTTSTTDMALDLSLFVESAANGVFTVVLSIDALERHRLELLGATAFPTREQAEAALTGARARLRIGSDGVMRDVAFETGAPDVFMNVVQWIVAQSTVSLGPSAAPAWEAVERGPFGLSRVRYERDGDTLTRSRAEYVRFDAFATDAARALDVRTLQGRSEVVVRRGLLEQVRTEERVEVNGPDGQSELDGRVRFELRLLRVDRGARVPEPVAYGEVGPAGEPVVGADTLQKLLEQRVAGMTREQLLTDLRRFGNGGTMPNHTRWLWQATGLLEQDPTLARELVTVALADGATDKARALVMDLLASTGHGEAQRAMREILAAPALASSPLRPLLLQRVSFLESVEPDTLSAVWDVFEEGKREGRTDLVYASAHALAAASTTVAANGDAATANAVVARLGSEIAAATTDEERAHLLGALTNAQSPEVLRIAEPYATSEDAALREAAAEALRKIQTPEATRLLVELVADSAFDVQSAALASLRGRSLDAEAWRSIAGSLAAGRLGTRLDGTLLTLAAGALQERPETRAIVAHIASRRGASAATRARALAMLGETG